MIKNFPMLFGVIRKSWLNIPNILRTITQAPIGIQISFILLAVYFTTFLLGPVLAPYGENEIVGAQYELWSNQFLLGTDHLGRDYFTRILYGARNSIGIALAATAISISVGTLIGLASACIGGIFDSILSRCVDIALAIPQLISSLILVAVFGSSIPVLILVLGLLESVRVSRLSRAAARDIVSQDYVQFSRLAGESTLWVMFREVLPNITPALVAETGLRFSLVFLLISALSFLGVGVQPPTADWGSMVRENATLITYGEITPLIPALAIGGLTVCLNLVIDWFGERGSSDEHF